jgi:hypothetical protein
VAFTTSSPTGELKNGLLFCQIRSWITGSRMVSLPFSDYCDPLVNSPDELNFLLDCMRAEMQHRGWKYLEFRPASGSFNPSRVEGDFRPAKICYLHQLDLRPTLEEIFQSLLNSSAQHHIRRAERSSLVCECGTSNKLLKDFYRLLILTRRPHDLPPQPYNWFRNLVDCMGDSLEIRVAYQEKVPTDAVLTLRFRNVVYYKFGCSDRKFKELGATVLLLWRAIQDSKATGAEVFDLGRSDADNNGLIAFNDHWEEGRTEMVYWRYPAPDSFGSGEGRWLKAAKQIFACMPHRLLAMTGKLIYRHIG